MANLNQPLNFNYANATNWKLIIPKAPVTNYFLQKTKVPDLSSAGAEQSTTFANVYHPSDHMNFDDFQFQYLADEDFANWAELFKWYKTYAMPEVPTPSNLHIAPDIDLVCDCELIILSNNKVPTHRFVFYNAFLIYLEGPPFDHTVTDIEPISLSATLRYTTYDYFPLTGNGPPCAQGSN